MVDGVVTRPTPWLYFMHPQSEFKIRVQISYLYCGKEHFISKYSIRSYTNLGHENDPNLMLIYCKVSNMQYVRKRENGADSVQPINVIDIRQDIQIWQTMD